MRRLHFLLCFAMWVSTPPVTAAVQAAHYDEFWVWAGVRPQPVLETARSLYILQGQIEAVPGDDTQARMIAQGASFPKETQANIWVVYRVHTLLWTPPIKNIVLAQLERWRKAGYKVAGIQIDFDARARDLDNYLCFLQELRAWLPDNYRLSITGLLDWSNRIEVQQVNQLRDIIDEVIVQTYQSRHTIFNYKAYLPRVSRLQVPYKIGLIQHGEWDAPSYLVTNPWFRGYLVFLRND